MRAKIHSFLFDVDNLAFEYFVLIMRFIGMGVGMYWLYTSISQIKDIQLVELTVSQVLQPIVAVTFIHSLSYKPKKEVKK